MKRGETHSYRTALNAGQFLHAVIEPEATGLVAKIYGTAVEPLAESCYSFGPEQRIFFVAEVAGEYRLELSAAKDNPEPPGRYEMKIGRLQMVKDCCNLENKPLGGFKLQPPTSDQLKMSRVAQTSRFKYNGNRQPN